MGPTLHAKPSMMNVIIPKCITIIICVDHTPIMKIIGKNDQPIGERMSV